MNENIEEIALADVFLDRETQIRAAASEETIQRYYDVMVDIAARDKFPPILLFRDKNGRLWLVDGHHRVMSAIRRKFKTILAIIRPGSKADAIWEAAKLNSKNGLQLGRADVHRAIEMIIEVLPERSSRAIAEVLGCSYKTVERHRTGSATGTIVPVEGERRIGRDGKSRPATVKRNRQQDTTVPKATVETAELNLPEAEEIMCDNPVSAPSIVPDSAVAPKESEDTDRRRIEANMKETQILGTISQLRLQIHEWFEIAVDDMHEGFDHRIRQEITSLVD